MKTTSTVVKKRMRRTAPGPRSAASGRSGAAFYWLWELDYIDIDTFLATLFYQFLRIESLVLLKSKNPTTLQAEPSGWDGVWNFETK
jgi:hypothetical protein